MYEVRSQWLILIAVFGSTQCTIGYNGSYYASVRMHSEAYGSHFVCVCVFVLSASAFSVDFGHR